MATNGTDVAYAADHEQAARSRRMLSRLLVIGLAAIAGAFFWATNRAKEDSSSVATVQSKPEPPPAPQDYREQAMAIVLSGLERKVLTEQLGALAARVDNLERALDNLERARAEIKGPSNKQSVGTEEGPTTAETKPSAPEERPTTAETKPSAPEERPTTAETKPSAPEEKPVRTEEERTSTLEKPAAAEENTDSKQLHGVPPGTGNPIIEPVDRVGTIPVPKQAELDPRKTAIGPPGCTHFRSFDAVSGTYTTFDGRRHQCR